MNTITKELKTYIDFVQEQAKESINKTIDNIYCDQLHDIIEDETGLRTSL